MRIAKKIALTTCVFFTIIMLISVGFGYAFDGPSYGLNLTMMLFGMVVALTALQAFWFTEAIMKKPAYPARLFGFGITALVVLSIGAFFGQWFPTDMPMAWVMFVAIYLIILVVMTIGYSVYYKKTAGSYDAALARYRQQNKQDKE